MFSAEKQKVEENTLQLLRKKEGQRLFVHFLLEGLSQEAMTALAERFRVVPEYTESKRDKEFAQRIGVRKYAPEERMALEIASMMHYFDYRKSLLANALSASLVAEMLGTSRQTPHDRVKAGLLLGILDNNILKFPEWQFDPEGPNGVVKGLPEVLAAIKCGTFAKISWLAGPNTVFDGLRPIDALKMGRIDEVVHEAMAVGVH
jgi:hypothetical protein